MQVNTNGFGVEDASYLAAGGHEGVQKLVHDFYDFMQSLPEAKKILAMHGGRMEIAREKLHFFLSGWLGGPKLYQEHYGSINIPGAHRALAATEEDRDAWLLCMAKAIDLQPYPVEFKQYLYQQLSVPAQRIVEAGRAGR